MAMDLLWLSSHEREVASCFCSAGNQTKVVLAKGAHYTTELYIILLQLYTVFTMFIVSERYNVLYYVKVVLPLFPSTISF